MLTSSEAESLLASCPPERLVIWAGAGISYDAPTRLPLGHGLTDFAVDTTCGTEVATRLISVWTRANAICAAPGRPQPFTARPRLESVLGGFAEMEQDAADPDLAFLPALTCFADAPPNAAHFALARLVLRGAAVFTSNFDLCLQAAVRELAGPADPFEVQGAGSIRRFRLKPGMGSGEIVHFHGVADDPEYLGATLSRIKEGLPEPFPALEERLAAGAVLLMAGYSASDSFDVNPWFVRQAAGTWPASTCVFLRHERGDVPSHLPELATGFAAYGVVSAHTGLLLSALSGRLHPVDRSAFSWQEALRARLDARVEQRQRALRTCAVAHALGINVDALDPAAYGRAESHNPGFDRERYLHLLAMSGRERGTPEKELEHNPRAAGSDRTTLGSEYARGRLREAERKSMGVDAIRRSAETTEVLPWRPYTSLSTHVRILLAPYLARPWTQPRTPEQIRTAHGLLSAAELLARRPLGGVLFIRQVATALRMKLLLHSLLFGVRDGPLESEILHLYAESADLAGFVSAYRDFTVVRLLRVRYASWGERPRLLWEAARFARRSFRLASVTRDRTSRRRAAQLALLVSAYGPFWLFVPRLTIPFPAPGSHS